MPKKLPRIGARIIKSAIAVLICSLIYFLIRKDGIVFYSQLACLWCMQPLRESSWKNATQRTSGTIVGALTGLIVILVNIHIIAGAHYGSYIYFVLISLFILVNLYICNVFGIKNAAYFSCVVFLSIVVNHIGDENPYLFVWNRFLDTMIGIAIGMLVNNIRLPYKKRRDVLFVSGIDDTLPLSKGHLNDYSLVELNRMIEDGALFTISTQRTPASLLEPLRGVNLKLPVIAMDGAVLYDINKNKYIYSYVLGNEVVTKIRAKLDEYGVNYFLNLLIDDTLIIQYKELKNDAEKDMFDRLHSSPYRNYVNAELQPIAGCVYVMFLDLTEKTNEIIDKLKLALDGERIRIESYTAKEYAGYSYVKIYSSNANRQNMLDYLKRYIGVEKTVSFGSIEGLYDITVVDSDTNSVVKNLKRMYEPYIYES